MAARPKRGQGTVRRRGNRYQATVQIEGRRYWETFERETDAWAWIATLKADAVRGVLKVEEKKPDLRFDDLCRLYRITKVKGGWRPGSTRFFDGHVKTTLLPAFGSRRVASITTQEIQRFLDRALDRVSPTTVTKYQQILRQVLNYAVRQGYLDRSPMLGVERIEGHSGDPRFLKLHELQAILDACPPEHRAFFTILALTGLRKSEIFRLSWDWCDFEEGKLLIKVAKRGSSKLPMSARVRESLLGLGPRREGFVFPGRYRDRSGPHRASPDKMLSSKVGALRRVLQRAGIEPRGVGLHTFRHTYVTLLEQIPGIRYSVVRALARHGKSGDITARYLHPGDEELAWALAQLEEKVFGPRTIVHLPRRAAP